MNVTNKYVLVVDDEEDVRNYLKTALQDAGFRVVTAGDGFEAIEMVKKEVPDLISLDLVMPKKSGAMFHRELKKNKEWAKVPVLIVTGHAHDDLGKADLEELTMSGPGIYLEKPVSPKAYVKAVCQLLNIDPPKTGAVEGEKPKEDQLRSELFQKLNKADSEALKRALKALKK
ncbi:response regulator [candidate division LCP-89 bacterium B3_LCP]|uniref:Response regulator n=1 Tax=candidate division LCP-89 bacterium B3_LCP TaxID=2012998 RepID=A0A532UNS0_UNCL8|nr:MAG: response regulator [candidate division LCP-89 bacterium B3_LCP]